MPHFESIVQKNSSQDPTEQLIQALTQSQAQRDKLAADLQEERLKVSQLRKENQRAALDSKNESNDELLEENKKLKRRLKKFQSFKKQFDTMKENFIRITGYSSNDYSLRMVSVQDFAIDRFKV